MIDPSQLVDDLVSYLQDIPALVTEMGGDATKIAAYHYRYPQQNSIAVAIQTMKAPGLLVAWRGTGPRAHGTMETWQHRVSVYIRPLEYQSGSGASYYRIFKLIWQGFPATLGGGQPMNQLRIHPNCDPMDVPAILAQVDADAIDYFELPLTFTEFNDSP